MILIPRYSRKSVQPSENAAFSDYWLSLGLCHAIVGDIDLFTGRPLTLNNSAISFSKDGKGTKVAASSNIGASFAHNIVTSDGAGTGDFTLLTYCAPVVGTKSLILTLGNLAGTNPYYEIYLAANADYLLNQSNGVFSATAQQNYGSGINFSGGIDGESKLFGYSRKGNVETAQCGNILFKNTVIQNADIYYDQTNAFVYIGSYKLAGWGMSGINSPLILAFNSAISDDILLNLNNNPWQVFESQKSYFLVSTSAGLSLVLANINQNQTLTEPTLAQQNILAVNNTNITQTINNISLIQQNILSILGLTQSQILTNVTLSQAAILSLANVTETETITNVELTQQNSLTLASLNQSGLLGSLTLAQQNILTLSNISQTELLNNINLTIAGTLGLANITQTSLISDINLAQQNILVLQSCFQTSTLENITLASGIILSLTNLTEIQAISALSLLQQNILTLSNVIQVQTVSGLNLITQATIIVNSLLQQEIINNIALLSGIIPLEILGTTIYMLDGDNPIIVLSEEQLIYITQP